MLAEFSELLKLEISYQLLLTIASNFLILIFMESVSHFQIGILFICHIFYMNSPCQSDNIVMNTLSK